MARHGLQTLWRISVLLILTAGFVYPASAQDSPPRAGFFAYRCEYQPTTTTAQIRGVLIGSDGLPMPPDNYTASITPAQGNQPLPSDQVSVTVVQERSPVRIILVLDITDTMPLFEVVNAISTRLAPRLSVQDEMALITVGSSISPLTQFYLDKNRLINEHILDIRLQEGDNRIYDGLLQAVSSFEPNSPTRQVVLMITDSGRRALQQASAEDIISQAQANDTQVYNIAFFYEDRPDPAELRRISDATHGYTWVYDGPEKSRLAIGSAVGDSLDRFINALNTEIILNVDLRGVAPDSVANGAQRIEGGGITIVAPEQLASGQSVVTLELTIDTNNDSVLTDQIVCPIQIQSFAINFRNLTDDTIFTESGVIEVDVESSLRPEQTRVVFWLNDAIVQESSATSYTFDALKLLPGAHTLRAQLRDTAGNVLATTRTVTVYAKQPIQLRTIDSVTTDLQGIVRFEAELTDSLTLPDVQFRIGTGSNPEITVPLGVGSAPVRSDGSAILTVNDIEAEIKRLFPDERGRAFEISAFIPGASPDKPLLAESNVLPITLAAPQPVTPALIVPWFDTVTRSSWFLPGSSTLALLILNVLLMRSVKRTRILRMINRPDDSDLSERLMTITVRRSGSRKSHILTKKTMYVGRGSNNDINLGDDARVSRQHGVVMWRKHNWYYANRKRNSRARINGKRVYGIKMVKLEPITEIEIGESQLIFHSNSQQDISELTKTNL